MEKSEIELVQEQSIEIAPDPAIDSRVRNFLVMNCSRLTAFVYLIIAILLVFAIILATVESVQALLAVATMDVVSPLAGEMSALNAAVSDILFIIVLATLIDLVRSYLKYGRVLVRPILVAGITTMVRRLLVWDSMTFSELLGIGIIILVLTVAIVFLGREDRRVAKFSKGFNVHETTFPFFKRRKNRKDSIESEE